MVVLKSHHCTIDRAGFLKVDKIWTLAFARMLLKGYDVRVNIRSTEFEQEGDSQNITTDAFYLEKRLRDGIHETRLRK